MLHTRRDNTVGPRPTLCGAILQEPGQGWVDMKTFATRDFEHLSHDIFDYSYCQECRDNITPMDYLNAVEL